MSEKRVDKTKRIEVLAGSRITLLTERMAFPSYAAWKAEVAHHPGRFDEDDVLNQLNARLGVFKLDIGCTVTVVNDAKAFDMVHVRLADGRECDITSVIEGEEA